MDGAYEDIAIFSEVLMLAKSHYVDEKNPRDLIYAAIDGMLCELDAYSHFLPPDEFHAALDEQTGVFSGVGMTVVAGPDNGLVVLSTMDGSPAANAGIQPGDRVLSVDGKPVEPNAMAEALDAFRGASGTEVRVVLANPGAETETEKTLVRAEIPMRTVRGARVLRDTIGYLRITHFNERTPAEFTDALAELKDAGARALILDLRGNPGGGLNAAVDVAEAFLPRGTLVVSLRGRDAAEDATYSAGMRGGRIDWPLAVLVNHETASAAEIISGALQDHKRAVILGNTTYGKASVQRTARLRFRPECAVRLTVARYYTPSGRLIDGQGVTPDITVDMPHRTWLTLQRQRILEESAQKEPDDGVGRALLAKEGGMVDDIVLERGMDILAATRILLDGMKKGAK